MQKHTRYYNCTPGQEIFGKANKKLRSKLSYKLKIVKEDSKTTVITNRVRVGEKSSMNKL